MATNHQLGELGEKLACGYLKKINYNILDKNWRSGRYGEIDIVAKDNCTRELVFIEVKSRATSVNDAKELVTRKKQKQLANLAKSYLYVRGKSNQACRFDVIAIKIDKRGKELEHIRNALYIN